MPVGGMGQPGRFGGMSKSRGLDPVIDCSEKQEAAPIRSHLNNTGAPLQNLNFLHGLHVYCDYGVGNL